MSSPQLLIDFYVNSSFPGIRRLRGSAVAIREDFDLEHMHFALVYTDHAVSLCARDFRAFKVFQRSQSMVESPEWMASTDATRERMLHLGNSPWFRGDGMKIPGALPLCINCIQKIDDISDREKSFLQQKQNE
jgi:hypothetical protein